MFPNKKWEPMSENYLNCIIGDYRMTFYLHLKSQEHNETNRDAQPETWCFLKFAKPLLVT